MGLARAAEVGCGMVKAVGDHEAEFSEPAAEERWARQHLCADKAAGLERIHTVAAQCTRAEEELADAEQSAEFLAEELRRILAERNAALAELARLRASLADANVPASGAAGASWSRSDAGNDDLIILDDQAQSATDVRGNQRIIDVAAAATVQWSLADHGWGVFGPTHEHLRGPYPAAAPAGTVLAVWRVPGDPADRWLVRSEDNGVHIWTSGPGYCGRIDSVLGEAPASDHVSVYVETLSGITWLCFVGTSGDIIHAGETPNGWLAERLPGGPSSGAEAYQDCTAWAQARSGTHQVMALRADGDLRLLTRDDGYWRTASMTVPDVVAGSLCGYAPGALHHVLFTTPTGELRELWSEDGHTWHLEFIGRTASVPPMVGRPQGGYIDDRHLVAVRTASDRLALLSYTEEWRLEQAPVEQMDDAGPWLACQHGQAVLAWRDDAGMRTAAVLPRS